MPDQDMPDQRHLQPEFDGDAVIAEKAHRQGVGPILDAKSLLGPRDDDDEESADDFLRLLREWRYEGTDSGK